jgi:hypothetical protein
MHFALLNPADLVIIVLPVLYYCLGLNFSLVPVLVLALVQLLLCTVSLLACYRPLAVGKHLSKGVELLLLSRVYMTIGGVWIYE